MTNRKVLSDGARLAQLVKHQTFNLRAMLFSPISVQMQFCMFVLYMETFFACFCG